MRNEDGRTEFSVDDGNKRERRPVALDKFLNLYFWLERNRGLGGAFEEPEPQTLPPSPVFPELWEDFRKSKVPSGKSNVPLE